MKALFAFLTILAIADYSQASWPSSQCISKEDSNLKVFKGILDFMTDRCETWRITNHNVSTDKLFMWLYTSNGTMVSYPATNAVDSILQHPDFKLDRKTMIYSHGFNGKPVEPVILDMGSALVKKGYNLLSFDSRTYLARLDYFYVANILKYVADELANLVLQMQAKGVALADIYFVGHSLGAQISGMVGRKFKDVHNQTIDRITGLDPAAPCFPNPGVDALGPNDAKYVDVIFTSILSYNPVQVGKTQYFVNGRHQVQPGCILPGFDIACSHSRSISLFVESTENDFGFFAKRCRNISVYDCQLFQVSHLGFGSDLNQAGNYTLETNTYSPFNKGIFGLF